jgi:hypothetical protein
MTSLEKKVEELREALEKLGKKAARARERREGLALMIANDVTIEMGEGADYKYRNRVSGIVLTCLENNDVYEDEEEEKT